MGAKHRRGNEGKDMVNVMLCFHFSLSPIPVFVISSFLSVEYLKY